MLVAAWARDSYCAAAIEQTTHQTTSSANLRFDCTCWCSTCRWLMSSAWSYRSNMQTYSWGAITPFRKQHEQSQHVLLMGGVRTGCSQSAGHAACLILPPAHRQEAWGSTHRFSCGIVSRTWAFCAAHAPAFVWVSCTQIAFRKLFLEEQWLVHKCPAVRTA